MVKQQASISSAAIQHGASSVICIAAGLLQAPCPAKNIAAAIALYVVWSAPGKIVQFKQFKQFSALISGAIGQLQRTMAVASTTVLRDDNKGWNRRQLRWLHALQPAALDRPCSQSQAQ